jgi:hypothetical protein
MADLKVELQSGFWNGQSRVSKFKVSNIGTHVATNVFLRRESMYGKIDGPELDSSAFNDSIGDVPAGAFQIYYMTCTPQYGWECTSSKMSAMTAGSDSNPMNDWAYDEG